MQVCFVIVAIGLENSYFVKEIVEASREQFSRPRAMVEAEIIKFHEPVAKVATQSPTPPRSNGNISSPIVNPENRAHTSPHRDNARPRPFPPVTKKPVNTVTAIPTSTKPLQNACANFAGANGENMLIGR